MDYWERNFHDLLQASSIKNESFFQEENKHALSLSTTENKLSRIFYQSSSTKVEHSFQVNVTICSSWDLLP